jgi:hypothetical protein
VSHDKSESRVLRDDPCNEPHGDTMQFRLTYEGPLHGSFNRDKRPEEKHAIRKKLHPQLRRLWELTPHLKAMTHPPFEPVTVNAPPRISRAKFLAENFSRLGGQFVPLVTEGLSLWCGLEVLFLRCGKPGKIYERGDIDNRMKTMLDALKMPDKLEELGDHKFPDVDEDPFYCLLEDDGLISKLTVETDTLLEPLSGGIPSESDARLVLTVTLRPIIFNWENMGFV